MAGSFDDFLNILQEAAIAYSRRQHKEAIPTCSNYDNTIHNDDNGAQSSSSPLPCHSSISPPLLHTHHHHHHHHYTSSLPFDHDDDLISDNTQFDDHELFLPLINSPMSNFSNNTNDSLTLQQYQGWWNDFFPSPSSPSSYTLPLSSHQQSNSNITTLTHESTLVPSTNSYSTYYENEDNSISISHEESFTTLTHESTLPSTNFYSTYYANEDNSISHEDSFSSPPPPKEDNLNMASKKIKLIATSSESRVDMKVAAKQKQRRAKKDVAKWMIMTKSQVDVMDDGFRWRKYGQKCVKKNATYPRSYFKCTHRGCGAQKRVERCVVDDENVLTTYHGIHTHYASS